MNLQRPRYIPSGLSPDSLPPVPDNFWGSVFRRLYDAWGDPYWWPGEDAWEVAAGAVLTQNTAWINVEQALVALKQHGWNSPEKVLYAPESELAEAIRPSGYFNVKAKKLKELARWWIETVESGRVKSLNEDELRNELLGVWGIGAETADSIACYAFGRPQFVVDTYTIRIVARLKGIEKPPAYKEVQQEAHSQLPRDCILFNHFHGLLVLLGKEHCRARKTACRTCPLFNMCVFGKSGSAD